MSELDIFVFTNYYIKRISEDLNMQFRAEFLNFLNCANFAVPKSPDNIDIFDSTGGSDWCWWLVDLNHNDGTRDSVRAEV